MNLDINLELKGGPTAKKAELKLEDDQAAKKTTKKAE